MPFKLPWLVQRPLEYLALYFWLAILGLGCLCWTAVAFPLGFLLPARAGRWLGRRAAMVGFRSYLSAMQICGVARFDLRALDALRGAGPLIIAPNHPGLLDALMVISRLPDIVCVFKATLLNNPLWGAGARLAGYVRNDLFVGSVNLAVGELKQGSQLLQFPEGTRSAPLPLGAIQSGVALLAHRAHVDVQTVIIEQDTQFLGKGWPLSRRPDMPMHFRVRLGRRFAPPEDPRKFSAELREYFLSELKAPPLQ